MRVRMCVLCKRCNRVDVDVDTGHTKGGVKRGVWKAGIESARPWAMPSLGEAKRPAQAIPRVENHYERLKRFAYRSPSTPPGLEVGPAFPFTTAPAPAAGPAAGPTHSAVAADIAPPLMATLA